jgi:alanyl-tRNA synthetase
MALFGEKYGDTVRVLDIGFSRELCGGTHVARTGDIGMFKLISETGVAAGVRRVEALTGDNALAWVQAQMALLQDAATVLRVPISELPQRILQMQGNLKTLEKRLDQARHALAQGVSQDLMLKKTVDVKGIKVLAAHIDNADTKALRDMVDQLKHTLQSAVVLLVGAEDGKIKVVGGVTSNLIDKVKAGDLVGFVSQQLGGKGGGRADMAMGGGSDLAHLTAAIASVPPWVDACLP